VGLLTLYSGLLLPWLAGTLWLVIAESRLRQGSYSNRFRQAGYGFFIGYAALYFAILIVNKWNGSVSWSHLMLFFLILTVVGGSVLWNSRRAEKIINIAAPMPAGNGSKLLSMFLLIWIAIHLFFITVEVFSQPLYPWDAWTIWAYRAKAWFLSGEISGLVSEADWIKASVADTFTTSAWRYPLFPSVITYWASHSLGYWSETLINLPVLFAGLAIGMALFGQCREHGLGRNTSLLCCYLLYSIPLFGTHIALAGYADIWVAGFSGLGFIALIRGLILRSSESKPGLPLMLGLLMIGLGILIKNEGQVWFLMALAVVALANCHWRAMTLIFAICTALTLWAYRLDLMAINLPLLGVLGVVDNQLIIPLLGRFRLGAHDIWSPYLKNFFLMGNWHLLWLLVIAALVLSAQRKMLPSQRIGMVFLGFFFATQLLIFGFTKQGLWAKDFTAINRLPLQLVPALLFSTVAMLHSRYRRSMKIEPGNGNQSARI
jgi:hypothetical protein